MNPNALAPGALALDLLGTGILAPDALAPSALAAVREPGDHGALSRQLLRYVVSCALDATQRFAFSWTDALGVLHDESYPGLLGLAASWATAPLRTDGQEWVSACLASRVNWYGTAVMISSRGPHPELWRTDEIELVTYPSEEGAFWGNLFADPPRLYACHHEGNEAHARLLLRDCAAGHVDPVAGLVECGSIHIVGSCDALCAPLRFVGRYHPSCLNDTGATSTRVITTFLP